jgi:hypothetical protein
MNTIDLSDFQKKELIEFYTKKLNEIERSRIETIDLLEKLKGVGISSSPNQLNIANNESSIDGYRKAMSWPQKAKFVLTKNNNLMTSRTILNEIIKYEPEIGGKKTRSSLASLSATLSIKATKGDPFKRWRKDEDSDYLYGMSDWFDENGEPKFGMFNNE